MLCTVVGRAFERWLITLKGNFVSRIPGGYNSPIRSCMFPTNAFGLWCRDAILWRSRMASDGHAQYEVFGDHFFTLCDLFGTVICFLW